MQIEILLTLAEIAVATGGFAAVIIVFKDRKDKPWNKFMFSGLIGHVVIAMTASFVPFILMAFELPSEQVWSICSLLLGIWTLIQVFLIIIIDKVSDKLVLSYTFISGLFCGTIVTLNGIGIYFDKTLVAYLVGIIWHLFQGILAFSIIMLKSDKE